MIHKISRAKKTIFSGAVRAMPLLLLMLLPAACEEFTLKSIVDGELGQGLTVSPSEIQLPANETVTFTVVGGDPPYSAEVAGNGSFALDTLDYTAPPAEGTETITFTDYVGKTVSVSVTVTQPVAAGELSLSPSAITVSAGGQIAFATTGGTPSYTYSVASGSGKW